MIHYGTPAYWHMTLALCLGSILVFSNLYTTQPLLPMLTREFGITELQASYSFTVTTLTLGLALIVYGSLSDAIGRRGLIIFSIAGLFVTTLCLSQVQNYQWLLILRAVQGFFIAGLPAIAVAYMADEFKPEAFIHSVGIYIAANSIGGIAGRLISGFVGEYFGWSSAFLVMGFIGIAVWLTLLVALPKAQNFKPKPLRPASILGDMKAHLSNFILLPAFILGGLNFFIFVNQFSFLTFVLEAEPFNLSPKFLGMLFLVYLTGTIGSSFSGKLGGRFGQPNCMLFGTLIIAAGTLTTLAGTLPLIIVGLLMNSFGFFLAHSSASSWVSRNATQSKATASSIYLVFYYAGASTGGLYLNIFWGWQGWQGVVIGSLIVLAITALMAVFLMSKQNKQSTTLETKLAH